MKLHNISKGFTLIELMIVVAIISIITAIAIPAYNGYISTAKDVAVRANADPLRLALEDYFLDNGTYIVGSWIPGGSETLKDNLGWRPDGDQNGYKYTVAAPGGGDIATGYAITVTNVDDATATITCTRTPAAGYVCP
jgi:prepilin-type N-terminal cleavage/methylation domain-containing protein